MRNAGEEGSQIDGGAAVDAQGGSKVVMLLDIDDTLVEHIDLGDAQAFRALLDEERIGVNHLKKFCDQHGLGVTSNCLMTLYDNIGLWVSDELAVPPELLKQYEKDSPYDSKVIQSAVKGFFDINKPLIGQGFWPEFIAKYNQQGVIFGLCSNTRHHMLAQLLRLYLSEFKPNVFSNDFVALGGGGNAPKAPVVHKMLENNCSAGDKVVLVDDDSSHVTQVAELDSEGTLAATKKVRVTTVQFIPASTDVLAAHLDAILSDKLPERKPADTPVSIPAARSTVAPLVGVGFFSALGGVGVSSAATNSGAFAGEPMASVTQSKLWKKRNRSASVSVPPGETRPEVKKVRSKSESEVTQKNPIWRPSVVTSVSASAADVSSVATRDAVPPSHGASSAHPA